MHWVWPTDAGTHCTARVEWVVCSKDLSADVLEAVSWPVREDCWWPMLIVKFRVVVHWDMVVVLHSEECLGYSRNVACLHGSLHLKGWTKPSIYYASLAYTMRFWQPTDWSPALSWKLEIVQCSGWYEPIALASPCQRWWRRNVYMHKPHHRSGLATLPSVRAVP